MDEYGNGKTTPSGVKGAAGPTSCFYTERFTKAACPGGYRTRRQAMDGMGTGWEAMSGMRGRDLSSPDGN
jgi:hypothetical protein